MNAIVIPILVQGKSETVYRGFYPGTKDRWLCGYRCRRVRKDERPNMLYCVCCGVAVAEVWPQRNSGQIRFGWCTRKDASGSEETIEQAFIEARRALQDEGFACDCTP